MLHKPTGKRADNQLVSFNRDGNYTLKLQVLDGCDWSSVISQPFTVQYAPNFFYLVSPNPASTNLHFELVEPDANSSMAVTKVGSTQARSSQSSTCEVRITNVATGALALSRTVPNFDTDFDLNVSTLQPGLYLLTLLRNGEIVQSQNVLIQ